MLRIGSTKRGKIRRIVSSHNKHFDEPFPTSSFICLNHLFRSITTMSLAELSMTEPSAASEAERHSGCNMTLPPSWWTSTSLFYLKPRAIFAKVSLLLILVTNRLGYTQPMHRISMNQDPIVHPNQRRRLSNPCIPQRLSSSFVSGPSKIVRKYFSDGLQISWMVK